MSPNKTKQAWLDMLRRCYDERSHSFNNYSTKGIEVEEMWQTDFDSFKTYVENLPYFRVNRSLDRIDNTKGYFVGNLRWTTDSQQMQNRGKFVTNTSGTTGVRWTVDKNGHTHARAQCYSGGKMISKNFSVRKFGLLPAFKMACIARADIISSLNKLGANYTETHGK